MKICKITKGLVFLKQSDRLCASENNCCYLKFKLIINVLYGHSQSFSFQLSLSLSLSNTNISMLIENLRQKDMKTSSNHQTADFNKTKINLKKKIVIS